VTDLATFIHATGRLLTHVVGWCFESQDRSIELSELLLVAVIVLVIYVLPGGMKQWLGRAESRLCHLYSHRKVAAIVVLGLLPAAARIAVLPAISIPIPVVPDEFSYLLLADTIGSGRITNPPHPLAPHFEATYILQHPTYTSVYPPAHGIVMGLAQLFGLHPWYGVLAEVSLMTMAIAWMLDAWFPPRWVLLGTMVAVMRLGLWMTSYWGGSLTVIGGALVLGSLKQVWDGPRARQGLTLGFGMVILANTRPYEGLLSSLVAVSVLAMLMLRSTGPSRRVIFRAVLIPLTGCLAAGAAWMAYYDWRVTGNPVLMPYVADQRASGVPQSFIFNSPVPVPPKLAGFKDLMDNYRWELEVYRSARDPSKVWITTRAKLATFWHFYLHPLLVLPLLALPWTLRDVRMRILLFAGLFVSFGMALYPFYFAHYSAPIAGVLIILVVQGLRHISVLSRKRPGGGLTMAPVISIALGGIGLSLVVLALVFHDAVRIHQRSVYPAASLVRDQIERRLSGFRDKQHLVIVRYGSTHDFHRCMTYNRADIDRAPVVWARELDAASNANLLSYYRGRTVWLYEPDETPPRISPYLPASERAHQP
jgi:hypothetical protein